MTTESFEGEAKTMSDNEESPKGGKGCFWTTRSFGANNLPKTK